MRDKILAVINNIHLTPKGKADAILALEVPGKYTKDLCSKQGDSRLFQLGNCPEEKVNLVCENCEFYIPGRPATIADITEVKDDL